MFTITLSESRNTHRHRHKNKMSKLNVKKPNTAFKIKEKAANQTMMETPEKKGPKVSNMLQFLNHVTEYAGFEESSSSQKCNNKIWINEDSECKQIEKSLIKDAYELQKNRKCRQNHKRAKIQLEMCNEFVPRMKGCLSYPGACSTQLGQPGHNCEYHDIKQSDFTLNQGVVNCVVQECQQISRERLFAAVVKYALQYQDYTTSLHLCGQVSNLQTFNSADFIPPDFNVPTDKKLVDLQPQWIGGSLKKDINTDKYETEHEDPENVKPTPKKQTPTKRTKRTTPKPKLTPKQKPTTTTK